jgi:ribosomal protein S14
LVAFLQGLLALKGEFMPIYGWESLEALTQKSYKCSYCNNLVSSVKGYRFFEQQSPERGKQYIGTIYICPHCYMPTSFIRGFRVPEQLIGNEVKHLPKEVEDVYNEARRCYTVNAYTGSIMLCRKLLMNIAVHKGAAPNQSFASYVDYLCDKGFVSGDNKVWADLVRNKGNDANHEIPKMIPTDAEELIDFLELVLKSIYEFPEKARLRTPKPPSQPTP